MALDVGGGGFSKRRVWLAGEKAAWVGALLEPGARAVDVALLAGVGQTALYRWRKELAADGTMSLPAETQPSYHHAGFIPVRLAEVESRPQAVSRPAAVCTSAPVSIPPPSVGAPCLAAAALPVAAPAASISIVLGEGVAIKIVGVPELALLEHVITVLSRVATCSATG